MFVTREKSDNDRKPTLPVRVKTMFVTRGNSVFTSGVRYKSQCTTLPINTHLTTVISFMPASVGTETVSVSPSGMLAIGIER